MRVLGYVISDSGRYSKFGYPDIRIPVEITNINLSSARGVDNSKVVYSLTPFYQQGSTGVFSCSRVFPTSSITPLWSVHSTMGVFSRWWRRRSNYGITCATTHQYDWLVKASSHQACLHHTQSLGAQCQE